MNDAGDRIEYYIRYPRESRSVEYKGPMAWVPKDDTCLKVVRTLLAMANLRDGGCVIVGINEDKSNNVFEAAGLSDEERSSWSQDSVADRVREQAEPNVDFRIEQRQVDGLDFIAIIVEPFAVNPVICRRDCGKVMCEGRVYCRPAGGKAETVAVRREADMRDILDLAIERRLQHELQLLSRARVLEQLLPDLGSQYDAELGDVADCMRRIETKGYWLAKVRPVPYNPERLADNSACYDLVQHAMVRLRGWDYPHDDLNGRLAGQAYVAGGTEPGREDGQFDYWRMYRSGQFVHWREMWEEDERDQIEQRLGERGRIVPTPQRRYLSITNTVWTCLEIFEFARRLSERGNLGPDLRVEVELHGTRGRMPFYWHNILHRLRPSSCDQDEIRLWLNTSGVALISGTHDMAAQMSTEILNSFGVREWTAEMSRDVQRQLVDDDS